MKNTLLFKNYLKAILVFAFFVLGQVGFGQVTVTSSTGIGSPSASYTTLAAAIVAINDGATHTGTIVCAVDAGHVETAPATGIVLTASGTAANPITFIKSGAGVNPTINAGTGTATPASAAPDGIFSIRGGDFITIDGFTFTDGNTTNPATMEFGIGFFKASAGNGCNNNTVQNCVINMQRINNATSTAPMIEGAVGILVINSTAIAATTALTPTNGGTLATNGTNSGNKFYTNSINSGNYGIGLSGFAASTGVGPTPTATTFLGDLGNDIGGVASGTGNSILNFGGGAATNVAAGIRANNQWSINISYNTIDNNNGSGVNHATTLRGIFAQAGTSGAATINNNNVTVRSGATTSGLTAIDNGIGSTAVSSNTININNNTIRFSYTTATSGVFSAITNSANAGTVNISSNNIQQLSSTNYPTTGTVVLISGSAPGGPLNITSNTISNFVMTGASGTLRAINATTPTGLYSITGNTIENLSYTTVTSTGNIIGIYNLTSATLMNVNSNIIRNLSTPTTGTLNGIQNNTVAGTFQCRNNQIYNFSTTAGGVGGFSANGITWSNANVDLSNNIIYAINSTGTTGGTGGTINGITHSGAATVIGNAIYDLSSNSTNVVITGITTNATGTNTVSNNVIGDLRAPNSTGNIAISGMLISGGTTNNIFHNTVNIAAATTSVTTFGTSAIYFSSSTPVNNLRNNIFVNTSAPGATGGFTAAIRYTIAPTSTNFPAANNNNFYYAGTAAANRVLYCEGATAAPTNGQQTIGAYKTYINTTLPVSGRESASVSEIPNFVSTTGSNPITNFLKYDTTIATQIEQGGVLGTGVTTDYSGTTVRCPGGGCPGATTTPDMGAWELNGILADLTAPSISAITFTSDACNTTSRSITALISDASGVNNASFQPRIYFRKNAGSYFSSAGSLTSGTINSGTWTFTINYATVGGVVFGNTLDYFIVAQDVLGNVGGNPSAGLVLTDVNTVSTPPTTPLTYNIQTSIVGSYNVGTGQTYTTLTAAVNAYNTSCLTGAVTFVLTDLSYSGSETFPIVINANSDASATNTLTIKPFASGTAITGSANSALIKLNGAKYVTIDGSTSGGTDRSLSITNTSVTTPGVLWIGSIGTTPTTNNALRNCIVVNGVNTSTAITISDATTSGSAGYFSNITIHNNDIQKAFIGVFAQGGTTPQNGSNLTITSNTLNTSGANAIRNVGIYMQGVNGATVSQNTIGNLDAAIGENDYGIWLATGTINATVSNNTVSNLGMTLTTAFAPYGIRESSGVATTTGNIISSNNISNLTTTGSIAVYGIDNGGTGTIIERNKVTGIINNNINTYGAYGINITGNNDAIIRNNFVSDINGVMTGGGAFSTGFGVFGIRIAAGTGHKVYYNSVNMYGLRPGTATTLLLTAAFCMVTTASAGCDVRNNIFANNITGGTTSIANVAVYLPSAGSSAMNLTMNNNLYYYGTDTASQGAGQGGTTAGTNFYLDLPALLTYSSTLSSAGTNDNASFGNTSAVPFASATDLHITTSNDLGVSIPSVPLDIDLNTRTGTPDIGAHEFTFSPCSTTVTWNGASWSATPDATTALIFDGDYTGAGLAGCSCQVNTGRTVTITSGTLDIQNQVEIQGTANLTFESGTNLLQSNALSINLGSANIKQNSAPMVRLDYTAWSSPVVAQKLKAFSPQTLDARFYTYDAPSNVYIVVANPVTTDFATGKGYLIRSSDVSSPSVAVAHNGLFAGVPVNGTRTTAVTAGFNLVGNPYPSKLDATLFLNNVTNSGLGITNLHFWTHTVAAVGGVYPSNNYATFNLLGGTAASASGSAVPNGIISVGQGFFVNPTTAGNATFLNTMRSTTASTQFFKSSSIVNTPSDKHRFWLNLTTPTTANNQILVGYIADASNDFDAKYDAALFGNTASVIYSKVADKKLAIQGRNSFTTSDVIPLGLQATEAAQFTISLADFDGLFLNQNIFLKDNVLNTFQNLKNGSYTFNATQGEFASRFEVVFDSSLLSTNTNVFNDASVIVIKNNNGISIETGNNTIDKVAIYDIRGRLLVTKTNINASTVTLNNVATANQVLIVKITNTDNQTVTKKVVN